MKSIRSEGGPFIILDASSAHRWGGVMHKSFMSDVADGENDYEALCAVLERPEFDRKGLAIVRAHGGQALVLGMPMESVLLFNDHTHACIVQAYNAEPEWSFELLDRSVTSLKSEIDPCFAEVEFTRGELSIFDSAYDYLYEKNDILKLKMTPGRLSAAYSLCRPDTTTLIGVVQIWSSDVDARYTDSEGMTSAWK